MTQPAQTPAETFFNPLAGLVTDAEVAAYQAEAAAAEPAEPFDPLAGLDEA